MKPQDWIAARLPCEVTHLDVAGCGRASRQVLAAQVTHLHSEAARGGNVAEAEAFGTLHAGRETLGRLLGLSGAGVAFSDGAGSSFAMLMAAWPLGAGARVGTAGSEYGSNALALKALADQRGWRLVRLPADDLGRLTDLPAGLDLVTFPQVASQSGILQPVEAVLASGVPLVLDVAQSLGQVPVPHGCAGYVGTSRKWLCGPRGVGFLAVRPAIEADLLTPAHLSAHTDVRRLDRAEAHVAGRVGLAAAVSEFTPDLLRVIAARTQHLRQALADTRFRVREPVGEPTGISTFAVPDPFATRAALLERKIVVSALPMDRSPDMTEPLLRVSTGAWVTEADLDCFVDVLASLA